jgi:hypothetical protein
MTSMPALQRSPRLHPGGVAFAVISTVAAAFTAILSRYRPALFRPYFAEAPPLLVITSAIVIGGICLAFLHYHGGFEIYSPRRDSLWPLAVIVVPTLLAVPAMAADVFVGFPRGMNVPAPDSLLFYPAIGYVAEVTFHLLPLFLFLFVLTTVSKAPTSNRLLWAALLFASSAEPIFQVAFSLSRHPFTFLEGFVGVHVLIFSVAAVWVFRRYDFVTMYLFRLVYYVWWHIVWGTLRLPLLF